MIFKIFIDNNIHFDRFSILMYFTKKYNLLKKYNIEIVNDYQQSQLILFLVSNKMNLINLDKKYNYIFKTEIPIILLEIQDSGLSWVREFNQIKNIKAVFKNYKVKPNELQNTEHTYYGKYHYYQIHKAYQVEKLELIDEEEDIGIKYYPKNKQLAKISSENLEKFMFVLWDFHNSPLCQKLSMKYFRFNQINFNKTIDIFCVNKLKINNFIDAHCQKAKLIVESLKSKYNVITQNLKKQEYEEIFSKCKIAISCWELGEWVHMDGYAMYAGAILIKPNSDHIKMYPDIYRSNQTYIPCAHDYSDLNEIIENILKNYNKYIPMIKENRKFILKINEENTANLFWQKVLKVMGINPKKQQECLFT
jgi:hypothetical protein